MGWGHDTAARTRDRASPRMAWHGCVASSHAGDACRRWPGSIIIIIIMLLWRGLLRAGSAMTVLGTPEFMAPELYEERYTAKVDGELAGLALLCVLLAASRMHVQEPARPARCTCMRRFMTRPALGKSAWVHAGGAAAAAAAAPAQRLAPRPGRDAFRRACCLLRCRASCSVRVWADAVGAVDDGVSLCRVQQRSADLQARVAGRAAAGAYTRTCRSGYVVVGITP